MLREEVVAISFMLMLVFGSIVSNRWYALIPKVFRRKEWLLVKHIRQRRTAMEALNSVDNFAAYGKAQREVAKLEKELQHVRAGYDAAPWVRRWGPYLVCYLAQFGCVVPGSMLWRSMELVMVPNVLAFGATRVLFHGEVSVAQVVLNLQRLVALEPAVARGNEWVRSIGVLSWSVLCCIAWWHIRRICAH